MRLKTRIWKSGRIWQIHCQCGFATHRKTWELAIDRVAHHHQYSSYHYH